MDLKTELFDLLRREGAVLLGAGDISDVTPEPGLTTGISVAIPLPREVVEPLKENPTLAYQRAYHQWNARLNAVVSVGAAFLTERGYQALALTTDTVKQDETWTSPLPHKSVAVRCGIGWIGKSGLLVTSDYGGAVRLSSLITDAPLAFDEMVSSRCGACRRCADACPAGAIRGVDWYPGIPRDQIFDREACKAMQLRRMVSATGVEADLCGLCFAVCPYTEGYLRKEN